jgi:hypothetical protein
MAWSDVFGANTAQARSQRILELSPYNAAASRAQIGAMATAGARGGGGNAALAARQGINAGTRAAGTIMGQKAQMASQLMQRDIARERAAVEAEQGRQRSMFGNLLGGASQLAGMLAPGLGSIGGAAGGVLGQAVGGNGGGLGAVFGGGGAPAAPATTPSVGGGMMRQGAIGENTMGRTLGMVDAALGGAPPAPGGLTPEEAERRRRLGY